MVASEQRACERYTQPRRDVVLSLRDLGLSRTLFCKRTELDGRGGELQDLRVEVLDCLDDLGARPKIGLGEKSLHALGLCAFLL